MKTVKIARNDVKTFARPSANAFVIKEYKKEEKIIVFPSIKEWFELRPTDDKGIMHTEFVRKQDITM